MAQQEQQQDIPTNEQKERETAMVEAIDGMRMIVPTVQFTGSVVIMMMAVCGAAIILALDPQHRFDPYFLGLALLILGVACVLLVFLQYARWPSKK